MTPFLRTLQGQAALFALTSVLAVLLAGFLATQTAFFEGYVVQKFPEPTLSDARLAQEVLSGQATLDDTTAEPVYAVWMTQGASLSSLSDKDAALIRRLVLRTLVSGSPEQRETALGLWRSARPTDDLRPEALAYARRLGREDVVGVLQASE